MRRQGLKAAVTRQYHGEETGDLAYQPVLATHATHPDALWTVRWALDDARDDAQEDAATGTATHPFWAVNRKGWVPMSELEPGDTLLLADARTARVIEVVGPRGPPATNLHTTYNIEVADYQTYFVGRGGIWVHNTGNACERVFRLWKFLRETRGLDEAAAFDLLQRRLPDTGKDKLLGEVVQEILRERRPELPTSTLWSPGRQQDGALNLMQHWYKHRSEFPELSSPIEYVDNAINFASNTSSQGTRLVAEGVQNGRPTRIVWDRNGGFNDYAVATVNPDGSLGPISTWCRLDRRYLETRRGLRDIPNGKDVFEQYVDNATMDMNGSLR